MKNNNDLYPKIYDIENLLLAQKGARKGKTKRRYVKRFQKEIIKI